MEPEGVRLQALMARAGIASRREAEQMILEGRVTLNGAVVTQLGTRAVPGRDHVKFDGKLIREDERKVYFLFHKPRGVITSVSDPHGRPVVTDFLQVNERIFPVGRLDWDTEGLLLLTNDGDLAYRLTHPKYEIPRTYQAKVKGIPDERVLTRLRRGIRLEDGKASVEKVRMLESTENNTWIELTVHEGRNRLVRRLLEAVGHPVRKLKRTSYAGLDLKGLDPGDSRALTPDELAKLQKRVAKAVPQAPARGHIPEAAAAEGRSRFAPPPPGFRPGKRPVLVPPDSENESAEAASSSEEE